MEYDDIINTSWPRQSLRPKMPLSQRAKIFLPFAALKGYEESLSNIREIVELESIQKTTEFLDDFSENF